MFLNLFTRMRQFPFNSKPNLRPVAWGGLLLCLGLAGCGGQEEVAQTEAPVVEAASDEPPPPPELEEVEGMIKAEDMAMRVATKDPDALPEALAPEDMEVSEDAGKILSYVETLQKKADDGDLSACYFLGFKYAKGDGVEQDYKKAAEWTRKAANGNNAKAQALLGKLYEDGAGVPQNKPLAYAWYLIAARQDDPDAVKGLGKLTGELSERDIEEAEQIAEDFVPN